MAETITPNVWEQIRAIPPDERVCTWHDDWHPVTHLPQGEQCDRPAVSVIEWTGSFLHPVAHPVRHYVVVTRRHWSFACERHGHGAIDPEAIGRDGWTFTVKRLPTWNPTWRATCGGCGWPIEWAWHRTVGGQECRNCQLKLTTGVS